MNTQIVLLRGVNVGSNNRIGMPELRAALTRAGFNHVRTYLQSGNVLADGDPRAIVAAVREMIDVPCVLRSASELDAAITANPFAAEATENPRALQVTFRAEPLTDAALAALATLVSRGADGEKLFARGREVYSWHPAGVARSKLAQAVVAPRVAATSRNWNTVLKLAELANA